MKTHGYIGLLSLAVILGACFAGGQNAGTSSGYPTARDGFTDAQQRGHGLYLRYCVGCHGVHGDGNGDNAPYLDPKPRDFTIATFKCRSTPTGALPLESDLVHTLQRGIQASGMPSWIPLSDKDRLDLVEYIKTFSPRWKTEKPGTPISVPAEPQVTAERLKHGQATFKRMECWKCHGVEGRGDGPSAATLTDSKDRPITPYDFTAGHRFKCGEEDSDLYKIFMTGVDGTPMPSFSDNLKPDEAWDLVFYLRSLQPMNSKERQIAKQLGLKPIDPNAKTDQPAADQKK